MRGLEGKVAVVTGGGGGIGTAICLRLADEGVAVMVADRRPENAARTAQAVTEGGGRASSFAVDVADPDDVQRLFDRTEAELGRAQVLVCSVAVSEGADALATAPAEFSQTLAVNVGSYYLCSQALVGRLLSAGESGAIVFISSTNAYYAEPGSLAYTTSKGAVDALTKSLALDYSARGVRVCAVAPGIIRTPVTEGMLADGGEEMLATWNASHAIGRIGRPEEMAAVVAFLASDDASFVTGSTWVADGGLTCGWRF
jgi:NAD(P)-dependent dehydrogenase (short-subunit alcohol dehydrogenase family)